jgi:hypothetical protein
VPEVNSAARGHEQHSPCGQHDSPGAGVPSHRTGETVRGVVGRRPPKIAIGAIGTFAAHYTITVTSTNWSQV